MKSTSPLLVTGAAGFIGARFVESCNHQGIPVFSVDSRDFFNSRAEHWGIDFGHVIDRDDLIPWLESQTTPPFRAIVHLGACTDTTELDRELLTRVNLKYSQELWNYCARTQIPLVYASSAATYGDGTLGYEDDESKMGLLKPLNPYGESKLQFDLWAIEQERLGVKPPHWSGFKFFNVYGYGERHKNRMASVVLHAFDQIRANGKMKLFKSHREGIAHGKQARDFVFVTDVVKVLEYALWKPIQRGIFNLGTGQARTYLDLTHAVFQAMSREPEIEFIDTPEVLRPRYQYFTQAQMDKLRAQNYLHPFTPLEEGVSKYISQLQKYR